MKFVKSGYDGGCGEAQGNFLPNIFMSQTLEVRQSSEPANRVGTPQPKKDAFQLITTLRIFDIPVPSHTVKLCRFMVFITG